jgi:hypothetical protein
MAKPELKDAVEMAPEAVTPETEEKKKKQKVMEKTVTADSLTIKILGTDFCLEARPADLPENVQALLPSIALSHMLGDAAAGKSGQEAVDRIQKKWDALVEGNLSIRKPAEKKISVSEVSKNIESLSEEEAAKVRAAFELLGVNL